MAQRDALVGEPLRLVQLVPLVQERREADDEITGGGWEGSARMSVALESAPDQLDGRVQMPQVFFDRGGAERRGDGAEAVAPALAQAQRLGEGVARASQVADGVGVLSEVECGDGAPGRFV